MAAQKIGDLAAAFKRVENGFRLFGARLAGYPMRGSKWVRRGEVIFAGGTVMMHPLDLIAVEYSGDPIGRLDAVGAYFTEQAHDDLDEIPEFVDAAVDRVCGNLVCDADIRIIESWELYWRGRERLIRDGSNSFLPVPVADSMLFDIQGANAVLAIAQASEGGENV